MCSHNLSILNKILFIIDPIYISYAVVGSYVSSSAHTLQKNKKKKRYVHDIKHRVENFYPRRFLFKQRKIMSFEVKGSTLTN